MPPPARQFFEGVNKRSPLFRTGIGTRNSSLRACPSVVRRLEAGSENGSQIYPEACPPNDLVQTWLCSWRQQPWSPSQKKRPKPSSSHDFWKSFRYKLLIFNHGRSRSWTNKSTNPYATPHYHYQWCTGYKDRVIRYGSFVFVIDSERLLEQFALPVEHQGIKPSSKAKWSVANRQSCMITVATSKCCSLKIFLLRKST